MGKREQTSELDLRPGMTLGRNYFAVEFLGSGWEGEVWKVEERATGIPRAAKIFYDRPGLRKGQIRRYAQKIYRLRSCPIVTQYHHRDVARVGGGPVEILVSDFVQGEVLSRYVQRQPGRRLPVYEALHLLHSLALGIEQIHVHGEYHADVHTGNILMKRRGLAFELHLIDFFDLGPSSREKIQNDVYQMILLLHEVLGGQAIYAKLPPPVRRLIRGRRYDLIRESYRSGGQLRVALENLEW